MSASDLAQVIEQDHRALDLFVRGDAQPLSELFSRRDDVTVANPFGPAARGWKHVAETMERAASYYSDGEATGFERVSEYATADLAYIVEVERYQAKVGGADEIAPFALRVTTVFRREDDEWKILHRHADPITAPRSPGSLLQQ
jgi:ketosteroid isomerase-like protein